MKGLCSLALESTPANVCYIERLSLSSSILNKLPDRSMLIRLSTQQCGGQQEGYIRPHLRHCFSSLPFVRITKSRCITRQMTQEHASQQECPSGASDTRPHIMWVIEHGCPPLTTLREHAMTCTHLAYQPPEMSLPQCYKHYCRVPSAV